MSTRLIHIVASVRIAFLFEAEWHPLCGWTSFIVDTQVAEHSAHMASPTTRCLEHPPWAEAVCMFAVVPSPTSAKSPSRRLMKEWKALQGPLPVLFHRIAVVPPSHRSTRTHPGSSLPLPQVLRKMDLSLRVDTKALQSVTCSLSTLCVSRLLRTRKGYRDLPDCRFPSPGPLTALGKLPSVRLTAFCWPALGVTWSTLLITRKTFSHQQDKCLSLCPCCWHQEVLWQPLNTAECQVALICLRKMSILNLK